MTKRVKQVLRYVYRYRVEPLVRAFATLGFRGAVQVAVAAGLVPRPQAPTEGEPERFLVVNPAGHLGDTIMLLPMILALRKAYPTARIECAFASSAAPILRAVPEIDRVYSLALGPHPPFSMYAAICRALRLTQLYWQTMRESRPTTCIVARWGDDLFRATTLAYLTQAPRRIGFTADSAGLPRPNAFYRDRLLTEAIRGGRNMHESAKFIFLLQQSGLIAPGDPRAIVEQPIPQLHEMALQADWPAISARLGLASGERFAILAPGASMIRRVWPLERWAAVIDLVLADLDSVVILSGPSDAAIARQLYQQLAPGVQSRMRLAAGATSLVESVALISRAKLFLGNDSGPGHVAGALSVPSVILLIGSCDADPDAAAVAQRIHPLGPHVFCCRPLHSLPPCPGVCTELVQHCITAIPVSDVLDATAQAIARVDG